MTKENFLPFNTEIESLTNAILICNYTYWALHYEQIMIWYFDSTGTSLDVKGLIVKFNNSEDRTLFLLKWA